MTNKRQIHDIRDENFNAANSSFVSNVDETSEIQSVETKNETLDVDENLKNTDKIDFSEEILSSTETLDTSFLEGRMKSVVINTKDFKDTKKCNTKHKTFLLKKFTKILYVFICILFFLIGGFLGFVISNQFFPKIKVVEKTKLVTEIKEKVDNNYLFLGDFITYFYDVDNYFKDLPVVKSSVSEYTTENVLKKLKEMAYQYNPSKIFLLIGTNDYVFSEGNSSISENIVKIIEEIQKNRPLAQIYLESIYPVNRSNVEKIDLNMVKNRDNLQIEEVNLILQKIAEEKNITYIDMYNLLYDEQDEGLKIDYTVDGLHISDEGYEVITNELKKYMD